MTATADIETVAFGDGVLAHNRQTAALCALNGIGGLVLSEHLAGRSQRQIAADLSRRFKIDESSVGEDIAALAAQWREVNLIVDAKPAGLRPVEIGQAGFGEEQSQPPVGVFHCDLTIACGGAPVRLRCEEPYLAALLEAVAAPAGHPGNAHAVIDVLYREKVYSGWLNGRIEWSCTDRALARHLALRNAIAASLEATPPAAICHASAVSLDGSGIVIAAMSGSGKTTLAAGLVAAGGKLISDDLLPLCADGEHLASLPFALSVKSGSWPIVGRFFPGLLQSPEFGNRNLQIRYFWPGEAHAESNPVPARLIVLPRRDAAAKAATKALSPDETVALLIETGTRLTGGKGALPAFARFAETVPAYAVTYPDLDAGIGLAKALLADVNNREGPSIGEPITATGSG